MPLFTDQIGQSIIIRSQPRRIISLVPSQTELLYSLGLEEEVIGITKFCLHPDKWFRKKTRIGGTKQLNTALIRQLNPDLIIANKEENVKEQVEELGKEFPVWVSDVNNLADAYAMIRLIGKLVEKNDAAEKLLTGIAEQFSRLPVLESRLTATYLIWRNPYMTVGGDTFIHSMLEIAGFKNSYADRKRYPVLSIDQIHSNPPDLLLLSSEPYPFQEKHIEELQAYLPATKILLVDGEMFSWYGSRLLHAASYFQQLRNNVEI